jgi:hypothetical protein
MPVALLPFASKSPDARRADEAMGALDRRWNKLIFWAAGMGGAFGEAQESVLHAAAVSQARSKGAPKKHGFRTFLDHWEEVRGKWKDGKFPDGAGDFQMIGVLMSELVASEKNASDGGYVIPSEPKLPKWEGFDESAAFRAAEAIDEAAKVPGEILKEGLPGGEYGRPLPWYVKAGIKVGLVVGAVGIGVAVLKKVSPFHGVRRMLG